MSRFAGTVQDLSSSSSAVYPARLYEHSPSRQGVLRCRWRAFKGLGFMVYGLGLCWRTLAAGATADGGVPNEDTGAAQRAAGVHGTAVQAHSISTCFGTSARLWFQR